jgi:hypothetical protein
VRVITENGRIIMKLEWLDTSFAFRGIDPFAAELLRRLPGCAMADDDAAKARIFPPLTRGQDEEADADWSDTVAPELRELFQSHLDVVAADLKKMEAGEDGDQLVVPVKHAPAWLHTLNQARLALGERHALTEEHLNFGELPEKQEDAFAMLQVEFYGCITRSCEVSARRAGKKLAGRTTPGFGPRGAHPVWGARSLATSFLNPIRGCFHLRSPPGVIRPARSLTALRATLRASKPF